LPTTATNSVCTVLALAKMGDKTQKHLKQQHFPTKLPTHLPTTETANLPTVLALTTMGDKT
jgi:hypothetical protein